MAKVVHSNLPFALYVFGDFVTMGVYTHRNVLDSFQRSKPVRIKAAVYLGTS